jgi:hypothetical protein
LRHCLIATEHGLGEDGEIPLLLLTKENKIGLTENIDSADDAAA